MKQLKAYKLFYLRINPINKALHPSSYRDSLFIEQALCPSSPSESVDSLNEG